ncbi:hypothetical protein JQ582_19845 [Bradyrhizobium japonicum]|uniref:helix-turn-helix domain-containing protein n=1 Tax=Bradyrhizobium japonicum TaxID=375 RepID=UPI001BA995E7|nr:helix-turn-helix domain-containing protein [Bradyrhizobium japonicum]MBR0746188.1 hypothetical protein [Bradyrhizobium japonicum]
MPDAKTLNATRAGFMRRASAPDVNPHALKLAYLIAFKHMDSATGTARPSQDTLAAGLNVSIRTVQRLLDILTPLGLVIVPGHGPGRSATYWIDLDKTTPMSPINTTSMSPMGARKGDNRRQRTRHQTTEKATPVSPPLKKNLQEDSKKEEYISEPSSFASPDAGQDTRESGGKNRAANASRNCRNSKNVTRVSAPDLAAFAEFWAIYPLKVGKLDAEKAYLAKAKAGVATAVMNAGAARYAAERSGQDPKFTKHPTKWIKGECWNDEPSSTGPPTIDEHGNVIDTPSPRPSRPQTIEEAADEVRAMYPGGKWD